MKHTRESIIAFINDCRANNKPIDLSGQDLSGLDLQDADLRGADLRGADLRRANLRDADLRGADLQDADLSGANLRGADLWRANLRGADLRGADLRWANLHGADLQEADFDFAGYELSCRTIGVKVGRRLVSQLLYHICSMNVQDCPEWDELRNDPRVMALANQSHVITAHKQPEIEPLKAQEKGE